MPGAAGQTGYPTTFSVRRPFGDATANSQDNACRITDQIDEGRPALAGQLMWSHYIDFEVEIDVRDGATRTAGTDALTYADGDEVRIPSESGHRYVVVFVSMMAQGSARQWKRAYLLRHTIDWSTYLS